MKSVLFSAFLIVQLTGFAQSIPESEFLQRMDAGEQKMKQGKYAEAQRDFIFIIENKKVLPSNLAYFFGRNSYHLKEYKQSINWLNKYIQLKGTKGIYYEEAVNFLDLAEEEYMKLHRQDTEEMLAQMENEDYDCGGLDKMICPVCKGSGVIISSGPFDKIYKTCPYSLGESYLSCEEYNLFMRGELPPKVNN